MTATQGIESRTHRTETAAEVVGRLRATFNTGVTRPLDWRVSQLQRLRALLVENEQELLEALWADLRKNAAEAKTQEIDFTVADIDEALANLEDWLRPRPVEVPAHFGPTTTAYTTYDPLGVVLVIAPWNFPLHLLIDPIIGALAAGNTVVAKPSEMSVHTSAVASRLLREYFDADVLTVVEGGAEETTALLAQRFDKIFYTGNGAVGRIVMAAAAKNLTPVTLELGGKSPVFVAPDADVDETAKRLVGAKFGNAGQQCIAPDYVLADATTAAALVPALSAAVDAHFGPTPQTSADFGRIINERHFDRLTALLDSGQVAVGGRHDRDDLYIAPTVLTDVDPASPVMQEEIFGPILAVVEVEDLDAAIAFINERDKPLALYAFTTSEAVKSRLVNETSSGGVAWGQPVMQLLMPGLPFGGVGESGMGRYHGRYSLETFSHLKAVADVPLN
ncbi:MULTISPECIES: aldehyde dehydrogenase family protein [Streptomyces]|uniref:Aldehyde dehydrogenase n=1 Tax=Streptomyces sviceus (strain ATCC 29083 / DSM 924 / JCM 4929 / NBRC 13980 / NCIMB 11184 / NRRL 5439 / UC 5370) TaxID=463191 RepID=B5HPP4_STRX2|nr:MULTISPECIES: aldehyde dehydrogenase family protein [Streptomyces]EDY54820.1 2-hydroxymuconic semialdehyde dehydrogenase [Streptomyces sviceus ATCC 29083]MYT10621.1 aldehyde dehydrogenase family protein [Streptomyces sp. SID5470]